MMTRAGSRTVAELFHNDNLPWEDLEWDQYPTLRALPTIGDGSCLVHAVYACLAPKHRDRMCSDNKNAYNEAFVRVRSLRKELAALLPEYYDDLPFKEFDKFKMEDPELDYSLEGLQKLIDSERYLGEEFVVFLSTVLSVNIIILDKNKQTGYVTAVTPLVYDKERTGTVIILYDQKRLHFEAAGLLFPNGHVATHFQNHNSLLAPFKRELLWE